MAGSRTFSPMICMNTSYVSVGQRSLRLLFQRPHEISLMTVKFQDPSFKSVLYRARNEQSLVTFFSKLMQLTVVVPMAFVCLADQPPSIILITPAPLGRTSSFCANVITGGVPALLASAAQKPKLAFCVILEFQREATLLI